MNRQLNQVDMPKQTIKNSDFQQSSFFNIGRKFKLARKTCSKATFIFMDEIFDYFSTETGKRLGYKILNVKKLKEELGISKSSLYRAIQEVNEKEIFIVLPTSENKFILYFINEQSLEIKRQVETGELIVSIDAPKPKFSKTNITTLPGKIVVSNLEKEVPENKNTFPKITNIESNMKQPFPKMIQAVPNLGKVNISKTIVNSEVETLSKKCQESFLKNPYKETSLQELDLLGSSKEKTNLEKIELEEKKEKGFFEKENEEKKSLELKPILKTQVEILEQKKEKIEFYFPTDAELEAKKKIENEIAKIKLDEMMAKIKAEKEIQKNNVPGPAPKPIEKSFVVETVSQNIDGDIVKEEKVINRLELNEEQRELREKIQEELNIININQFEDFFYKLDFDTYYETVSFVISEYKSGNVKSPSNYLKACLNKKVESQGIENLTTPFYWQQIFRYFNLFHFDKGSVVCTKSGVTLAHQMSANQDRVFLYLSTVFREVKKGNEEKQKELIEVFQAMGKFGLTVQEFKEIVSFNSATKENKEELIKIFREVI